MNIRIKIPRTGRLRRLVRERGNALILIAIAVPALLAAAGLALDWGRGVWVRTQLQKAADAGALAGAAALPDYNTADLDAADMVASNFSDPDNAVYIPMGDHYRVQLSETVPTVFMLLFGHDTMEIGATATAVARRPTGGLRGGAFPFCIINPDLNDDPTDDLDPQNYGRPYIIKYGEDNVMVPDWANGSGPVPAPPDGNSRGWRGMLGLAADGTTSSDTGTEDIVYSMVNGWPGTAHIGDWLATRTGNIDQPIIRARDELLGDDPILWEDFDPEIHANSSRVIMVPIVHLINDARQDTYTMQDYNNGAAWVHEWIVVDGFAPFFLLTVEEQGNDVDCYGGTYDREWMVGYFIPGVETRNFLPSVPGNPNYGLFSPPRLID